jgi:Icc-related predicted phosphoesterase
MKILLSVDAHGEIPRVTEKIDLILIAGDFAKGDKLRKMIFEGGSPKEAKEEIIESSKQFFDELIKLNCPIVASLGNAEEFAKSEIIKLIKEKGIIYCDKNSINIKGIKIICLDFFVEKWWAEKYKPDNENTQKRANDDEEKLKNYFKKIKQADIILSHLPPYEILDISPNPPEFIKSYIGHMGSKILKEVIIKVKPKLVVCGHIHIPGEIDFNETKIINPGPARIIEFVKG